MDESLVGQLPQLEVTVEESEPDARMPSDPSLN